MIARLYEYLLAQSETADKTRAFVDAQRLAYADRDRYFADPDYVDVPIEALLDGDYLRRRALQKPRPEAAPRHGNPGLEQVPGTDTTQEPSGTTHLSIVDNEGNAVSFTATVGRHLLGQRAGFRVFC